MKNIHFCFFLFLSAFLTTAQAQEPDDTRRLLEHSARQQETIREDELLQPALTDERPTITINGQTHTIEHNANDIGRALYLSVQQRQWNLAAHFLAEYLILPDYDPLLVHYSQGALARVRGKYRVAESEFRALLEIQPGFLPARLELARVLFEDYQNRAADELFAAIAASLDSTDPATRGVHDTVAAYRAALSARRNWNGVFALGYTWSDNVNRTSASQTCLLMLPNGLCLIDRKLPDAIVASGYEFETSASKHFALSGHHGVYLRALGFGQGWRDNSLYNELNTNLQAGYSYRSGRQTLMLAPSFDYYALGNSALYAGFGVHGQWSWLFSPRSMVQVEMDWKDIDYRRQAYALNYDGIQRSGSVTYFRSFGRRLSAFGGLDITDSGAPHAVNAWRTRGGRGGLSWQWPAGFSHTVSVSARQREYAAYSALLGARRKDHELGATLAIRATRWALNGFTPLLTLRHYRVNSNVDWLYRYRRNTISLKLQRGF